MIRYLTKRLAASVLILVGVSAMTFALNYVVPADPVAMIAARNATKEDRDRLRQQLGLDQPLAVQYARYMTSLAQGDLGRSYKRKMQVAEQIWARLPATLILMAAAIGCELLIGIPAGIYAARRRGNMPDKVAMTLSFIGVSAPQFVTGLVLLYIFAFWLDWLPTGGFRGVSHVILPAVTLGIAGGGWYSRMMRSSMSDVLSQDYIRTARAKGLDDRRIIRVHALRNAVLPIVAMIGLDVGIFMSGVVVVESVYGWPGIGQLMWQGIQDRDLPIIMGVTLTAAVFIVLGSLLADLIAPLIDPRIRLR